MFNISYQNIGKKAYRATLVTMYLGIKKLSHQGINWLIPIIPRNFNDYLV